MYILLGLFFFYHVKTIALLLASESLVSFELQTLPLFVCPPVQIDKVITLPPEPIEMPLCNVEETISIHPPNAHSGPGPVNCRLISYELREGQVSDAFVILQIKVIIEVL